MRITGCFFGFPVLHESQSDAQSAEHVVIYDIRHENHGVAASTSPEGQHGEQGVHIRGR